MRRQSISQLARTLSLMGRSARVKRYHTEPTFHSQTVGEHTYGVVWLVLLLTEGTASKELIVNALFHDTPESETGDVPAPTKRRVEGMKASMDQLEHEVMVAHHIFLPEISEDEARILKQADVLEGGLFCAFELRRGNHDILTAFGNYISYGSMIIEPDSVAADILNIIKDQYDHFRK